jgi:hypothetical protein
MTLTSHAPQSYSRREFCLALKAARERKGVTLAQIAASTKIPASLFAALERADLRRWPKGLFKRSFFRDYAGMIGVPVAETCEEFVRLFPDDVGAARANGAATAAEDALTTEVRLVFDTSWHGPRPSIAVRLLAAIIDSGAVMVAAVAVASASTTLSLPSATALAALAYFSFATVVFGESPAKWVLDKRGTIVESLTHGFETVAAAWSRSAGAISKPFISAESGTPEPPSPQLRVNVKVS